MAWDDILADEKFQAEPEDVKITIANNFFDENIGSNPDYQAEAPETQATIRENFMATLHPQDFVPEEPSGMGAVRPERTVGGTLQDIATTAAKGVAGVYQGAVGLADIPTFGYAGKLLEQTGADPGAIQQYLDTFLSPAQQAANKEVAEAEGFLPTLQAALDNPSVIMTTIGESLIPAGVAGKVAGVLTKGTKAAKYAAGIGEGALMAGTAAEQLRAEDEDGTLGVGDIAASLAIGTLGGAIGFAGSKVAAKMGFADIDALAAGVGGTGGGRGLIQRVVGGGVTEGVFEELPQTIQETIFMNAAQGRPLLEDLGSSAAMGLIAGMGMGAGVNVFAGKGKETSESALGIMLEKVVDEQALSPDQAKSVMFGFNEFATDEMTPDEKLNLVQDLVTEELNKPEAVAARVQQLVDQQANVDQFSDPNANAAPLWQTGDLSRMVRVQAMIDAAPDATPLERAEKDVKSRLVNVLSTFESPTPAAAEIRTLLEDTIIETGAPLTEEVAPVGPDISPKALAYGNIATGLGIETAGKGEADIEAEVKSVLNIEDEVIDLPEAEIMTGETVESTRRKDTARRAEIDKLFAEGNVDAAERMIFEDPMTGALNRRAFEFDEQTAIDEGKSFASIDMSGLKWVNDTFGHDFGDGLLKLMGEGLIGIEGANTYRLGGDEYVTILDNPEEAATLLDTVKEQMEGKELEVTLPDGTVQTFKGWSFDYGTGQTYGEADANLTAQREQLSAEGKRVGRGGQPVGVTQVAAKGVEGEVSRQEVTKPVTPVEKIEPKAKPKAKPKAAPPSLEKLKDKVEAGDFDALLEDKGWKKGSVKIAINRKIAGKVLAPVQEKILDALEGKAEPVIPVLEKKVPKKKVLTSKTATSENLVVGAQFRLPGIAESKNIYEIIKVDGEYLDVKGVAGNVEGDTETFTIDDITEAAFQRKDFLGEGLEVEKVTGAPSRADITAAVDIITTKWVKAPPIHVVARLDQLPKHLFRAIEKANVDITAKEKDTKVSALYDPSDKSVYLIAENIDSLDDAREALFHEALGHYGLNSLLGKQIRPVLNQVYIKYRKEAQDVAAKYGFDLSTERGRQRAAEEVLANIAQENSDLPLLNRVYAIIRKWLKAIGLAKELTDNDIRNMIADAALLVKDGARGLTFTGPPIYHVESDRDADDDLIPTFKRQQKPIEDQTIAENRRIYAPHSDSRSIVKRWAKRWFTKEGLLTEEAFAGKLKMAGALKVGENDITIQVNALEKQIAKAFGKKKYGQVEAVDKEAVNTYLAGDPADIPNELKAEIDNARAMLDELSDGMLQTIKDLENLKREQLSEKDKEALDKFLNGDEDGRIPASLQKYWTMYDTIEGNKGTYLNRSYAAFDDADWLDKVIKKKGVIKNAERFIAENNPDLTREEVVGAVGAILESAKETTSFMSMVSKGTKLGSKDVSITRRRKGVPEEIRALLGEYKDPKVNFIRSATKMQWYVANHNFLMGMRRDGMDNFLYEKPTGEFKTKIATKGSETMNPLGGLYTTPDFNQGLMDSVEQNNGGEIMRWLINMNSKIKYGKTILSPTTQVRNFMSAGMFAVMNGHMANVESVRKAGSVAWSDLFTHDKKWQAYLDDLIQRGVLHDNPFAGELKDAVKDFAQDGMNPTTTDKWGTKIFGWAEKSYAIGDDFWKIIGYESEVASFKKAGLSDEEAKSKAAVRIRDGYPTYSMVPKGIKAIRRWPLIGTFVSFPYEIIRTTRNQFKFISEDMSDPRTKGLAVRRMIGMSMASSMAYSASIASMALMGMDADDDEAIRAQLPDWSRNSQLMYTGYDKDGLPTYIDLGFIDPYTYLKKPLTALASGNNRGIDAKVIDAMQEFLDPFIGTDIGAGTALALITNKKPSGGEVYNEEDVGWKKAIHIADFIRLNVQPGILSNTDKTIKALGGDISRSGKMYSVSDEAWAWAGLRLGTLNLNQSMNYKGYGFRDRKTKASRILNHAIGTAADTSPRKIKSAVSSMIRARHNAYTDMIKLIEGSKKLGVSTSNIVRSLKAAGVSREDITALLRGKVPQWKMKPNFLKAATERALVAAPNMERKKELRVEMRKRRVIVAKALRAEYRKKTI